MNKSLQYASLVSGLFLAPLAAVAHHSVAGTLDTDQVAETEGEVTSVLWLPSVTVEPFDCTN